MENGRRGSGFRERERQRQQSGRKFARLVERATESGFSFEDAEMGAGKRVIEGPLRISASRKTTGAYLTEYREVMMGGDSVFLSRATYENGVRNSSQVLVLKSGPWERILKRAASAAHFSH